MHDLSAVMIPLDDALRLLDRAATPLRLPSETLPVRAALGRVVRAPQVSRLALPPFDKSAVDGYALPEGDERGEYRILQTVHAGQAGPAALAPGTTVKVMTGAPVPAGTGRVVMREEVVEADGWARPARMPDAPNFCRRGEDLRPGDLVVAAGTTLSPLEIGNLIAAGITEVEVSLPVRLAILSTGDEITDDPALLAAGRIMDSNGPMLAALAAAHGMLVTLAGQVPDEPGPTREFIARSLAAADLVVISGGVSAGDSDFVTPALVALGLTPLFTRVAVKPGKPVTFSADGRRLVLALPGNPVSAWLMFHLCGLRIAAHLLGAPVGPRTFRLRLAAPFARRSALRQEFVPARLRDDGSCETVPYHGSANLGALAGADGFFVVPPGVTALEAGSEVGFLPLSGAWPDRTAADRSRREGP